MSLSNISGQQPKISEATKLSTLYHNLTMFDTLKTQTFNTSILSEADRLAEYQKQQCEIQNEHMASLEFSVIKCKSQLSESELQRQKNKYAACEKESLLQQDISSANHMLTELQENMNTVVAKNTNEKIAAWEQVSELQKQILNVTQKTHIQQEEINFMQQQRVQLQVQKEAAINDMQTLERELVELYAKNSKLSKLCKEVNNSEEREEFLYHKCAYYKQSLELEEVEKQKLQECKIRLGEFETKHLESRQCINDLLAIIKSKGYFIEDFEEFFKWHIDLGKGINPSHIDLPDYIVNLPYNPNMDVLDTDFGPPMIVEAIIPTDSGLIIFNGRLVLDVTDNDEKKAIVLAYVAKVQDIYDKEKALEIIEETFSSPQSIQIDEEFNTITSHQMVTFEMNIELLASSNVETVHTEARKLIDIDWICKDGNQNYECVISQVTKNFNFEPKESLRLFEKIIDKAIAIDLPGMKIPFRLKGSSCAIWGLVSTNQSKK